MAPRKLINHLVDHKLNSVSLSVEDKGHVELGMPSHPHPLVHEDQHVFPCHSEDGLGEGGCVPDHIAPGARVCLHQPCIVGQGQKLIEHLTKWSC